MPRDITRWRRLRWRIEAVAAVAAERAARAIPTGAVPRIGSTIGVVAYALDVRHRRVALDNIRRVYGSAKTAKEQKTLVRRCFAHFGRVAVELLRFGSLSREAAEALAEYEGVEHLRAARTRGRGVLICAAHFGNWELHALLQGWINYPVALVTRPMDNPALEHLVTRLRGRSGNTTINKRVSFGIVLRALRRGDIIGILVDQRPRRAGLPVPFLGRQALTSPAPALLALRTGAALVPAFSIPQPDGTYRLVYEPEISVSRTGNIEADARRLTELYTSTVERWVWQHPELWLWMHDRWKNAGESARQVHATHA